MEPPLKINELITQRAAALAQAEAVVANDESTQEQITTAIAAVDTLDTKINNARELQKRAAMTAKPVEGQENEPAAQAARVAAAVETDPYLSLEAAKARGLETNKGLVIGGMMRMIGQAASAYQNPADVAKKEYGESHPVTRSLLVGTGASGGFIVPPDYRAEIIELLRPIAVVRGSGPRVIPMPRGTMTIPGQASAATATYGSEVQQIAVSQQTLNKIVLSYKKLTAMVPVSNDMMRYSDPAVDAFVRDDLVKVMALREDSAFMFGDGTADTPFGWLTFANDYVSDNGGTIGSFSTAAASTFAVNGTDPAGSTGGNFITSTETFTVDTVADELGGAINRLDQANVGSIRRVWFMSPRSKNYLVNARNSLSLYIWRDEMMDGTLLGYPFRVSNQIGNTYQSSAHTDCSFIFLVEMPESILADSMQLELAVSRDASYVDSAGATISTFQNDQTLIRAIAEHDFSVRHRASVAVIQRVRWAPAVS
jgi:HK97 family phage major capsid protein